MRNIVKILIASIAMFIAVGCGGSSDPGELKVDKVKGGELIADVPANILKAKLIEKDSADKNTTVFGFKAYKIPYTTTDDKGKKVKASGVMVVPTAENADGKTMQTLEFMKAKGLAMVVDCHGTIFSNDEAPSVSIKNSASAEGVGIIYSSLSGFVTLQPDYIGFGDSKEHYQAYLLKQSSANSVVDFTKAAIEFAKANNIAIATSKDIYLTGYSQGGYVALAALKKFEAEQYNVIMATPMAGPYLLDPIAGTVLSSDTIKVPSFMAAVAYAYAKTYDKDVKELIQEPYASKLPSLYNGSLIRPEIDKELTTKIKGDGGLFTDSIATNYQGSWFQKSLQANSVVDFTPKTAVEMLHCLGDDVVDYNVSKGTRDAFVNQLGANHVNLIPVEIAITKNPLTKLRLGHIDCALPSYKVSAYMFATMRKNTPLGY